MDRFIKTLGILIIMLFLLASGIDVTLDRLARSPRQSEMAIYGTRGTPMLVYRGDLERLAAVEKMDPASMPRVLRRVKTPDAVPATAETGYRWL